VRGDRFLVLAEPAEAVALAEDLEPVDEAPPPPVATGSDFLKDVLQGNAPEGHMSIDQSEAGTDPDVLGCR